MDKIIYPSDISGKLVAPPSKSLTQRAIAAGLLANGTTIIHNPSFCNDTQASLQIAANLGAAISVTPEFISVTGSLHALGSTLNCGESGLAMRMFAPIAALLSDPFNFTGKGSLINRPVSMIEEALSQLGVSFESTSGFLPFRIQGPIKGGIVSIDGSLSSQLLTGLLIALPKTRENSEIRIQNLNSKPYIDLTLELLANFGIRIEADGYSCYKIQGRQFYRAREYFVEGDWSNSSFLLVAGAIKGCLEISGLRFDSKQADITILEALQRAGAFVVIAGDSIQVTSSQLNAFRFDASQCPDLFPPLAALAAYCNGTSVVTGITRLIHKESNRALSIREVMGKLGVTIDLLGDEMHIHGGNVRKATIHSHNDHRIAMMASVAALGSAGPVTLSGVECVEKSYPEFFENLELIGAKFE